MTSYTDKTITGINYNFLNISGKTLLQFIIGIVLARLLPPKDFGVLGMAYLFIGLANLFSSIGLGAAVIQKQNLTREHIRIAATLTFLFSILIYIFFWFFSSFIAGFFNHHELTSIIRVISVIFIFQGFYSISYGLVIRDLDFKTIFIIETISLAAGQGLVSIILALSGFGVWSLVYGRLITVIITFIFFTIKVRFPFKPLFKKKEAYELFGFGSGVSLTNILNYSANNIDYLTIGKFLTPAELGLYTRAYNIMTLPISQISQTLSGVLFSAYSGIQNDIGRLKKLYLKSVSLVGLLAFPLLSGMISCGYYIISGLYGKNWIGTVPVFKILAVSAFFKVVYNVSGSVIKATGNVYKEAWRQFVYLIILGSGVIIGVRFGIEGVAYAAIIASFWFYSSLTNLVKKVLYISNKEFHKAQLPGLIISAIIFSSNQAAIFLLESFFYSLADIFKLFILVFINIITISLCFIFLPENIKGDLPGWIFNKYKNLVKGKIFKKITRSASANATTN